jgi:hypothetical protein
MLSDTLIPIVTVYKFLVWLATAEHPNTCFSVKGGDVLVLVNQGTNSTKTRQLLNSRTASLHGLTDFYYHLETVDGRTVDMARGSSEFSSTDQKLPKNTNQLTENFALHTQNLS